MVVAGHYIPAVRTAYMWGGLGLSLIAGLIYAIRARGGWTWALLGGLIAGGVLEKRPDELVTVDNGIASHEGVAHAKALVHAQLATWAALMGRSNLEED